MMVVLFVVVVMRYVLGGLLGRLFIDICCIIIRFLEWILGDILLLWMMIIVCLL